MQFLWCPCGVDGDVPMLAFSYSMIIFPFSSFVIINIKSQTTLDHRKPFRQNPKSVLEKKASMFPVLKTSGKWIAIGTVVAVVIVSVVITVWLILSKRDETKAVSDVPMEEMKHDNTKGNIPDVAKGLNLVVNGTFSEPSVPNGQPSLAETAPNGWSIPPNSNLKDGTSVMFVGIGVSGQKVWSFVNTKNQQFAVLNVSWRYITPGVNPDFQGLDIGPYIEQTISNLRVGTFYSVLVTARARPKYANGQLSIFWDSIIVLPRTDLQLESKDFGTDRVLATKASHTLRICFTGSLYDNSSALIEDVVVKAVP